MRRQFGYFIKGMEYYSTALWHLQRDTDLSALSQELTEQHRNAPEVMLSLVLPYVVVNYFRFRVGVALGTALACRRKMIRLSSFSRELFR